MKAARSRVVVILIAIGCLFAFSSATVCLFRAITGAREQVSIEAAAPQGGHFVDAAGIKVFVQEEGSATGTAVVLIHGTGSWSEIWRPVMDALSQNGYRAIAIDLPPFSYSQKLFGPDAYATDAQAARIIGVLDALQIHRAILVGHSVGARPTLAAALEHPDRVSKLVLVDPALSFQSDPSSPGQFQQNDPSFLMTVAFKVRAVCNALVATTVTNTLFTKRFFSSFVYQRSAVTPERVAMLQAPFTVRGFTSAYGDWFQNLLVNRENSPIADFSSFHKLTVPVTLLWGAMDTVTPLWQGRELQALFSSSTLVVIPNAGHIPYIEQTDVFDADLFAVIRTS